MTSATTARAAAARTTAIAAAAKAGDDLIFTSNCTNRNNGEEQPNSIHNFPIHTSPPTDSLCYNATTIESQNDDWLNWPIAAAWVDSVRPREDNTLQTDKISRIHLPCLNVAINETLSIRMIKGFRLAWSGGLSTRPKWILGRFLEGCPPPANRGPAA